MLEWTAFLLHSDTVIFTGSIGLMLGLFLMETVLTMVVGTGVGHLVDHALGGAHAQPHVPVGHVGATHDLTNHAHLHGSGGGQSGGVLGWLQLGRVPFMIWLVVLLTTFGLGGLALQGIAAAVSGHFLSAWLAAPLAFVASLPVVRKVSRGLGRLVPQEESSAVDEDHFLGREAVITLGVATAEEPAEAKVQDMFGRHHYIRVVPSDGNSLPAGTHVTLMRRLSPGKFSAEPMLGSLPAPDVALNLVNPNVIRPASAPVQDR